MERYDRLTTLIDKFKLTVSSAVPEGANLVVYTAPDGTPDRACFRTRGTGFPPSERLVLFWAHVDWSGLHNPFLTALPDRVDIELSADPDGIGLVRMMQSEIAGQRCGVDSVLNRLGEVLIVRMMRAQIEAGSTQPGLLAGLSDQRLSRAIVAMHDKPGQAWRTEDLAQLAGMSRSRFAERFYQPSANRPRPIFADGG